MKQGGYKKFVGWKNYKRIFIDDTARRIPRKTKKYLFGTKITDNRFKKIFQNLK